MMISSVQALSHVVGLLSPVVYSLMPLIKDVNGTSEFRKTFHILRDPN